MDENNGEGAPIIRETSSEFPKANDSQGIRDRLTGIPSAAAERVSDSERLRNLQDQAKQAGRQIREDPLKAAALAAKKSQDSRLAAEEANKPKSLKERVLKRPLNSVAGKLFRMAAEMIPSPVLYGPGDVVALLQAIIGKDTGLNTLDSVERMIYLIGAGVPGVPALPIVLALNYLRHKGEDITLKTIGHKLEVSEEVIADPSRQIESDRPAGDVIDLSPDKYSTKS